MPSASLKQKHFMRGCKENPGAMDTPCPPEKVAAEFVEADKESEMGVYMKKSAPALHAIRKARRRRRE